MERDSEGDLETAALRQVARRVETLMSRHASDRGLETPGDATADDGFGWEEAVLRRLRARLFSGELAD